jgi:hypothetical protein
MWENPEEVMKFPSELGRVSELTCTWWWSSSKDKNKSNIAKHITSRKSHCTESQITYPVSLHIHHIRKNFQIGESTRISDTFLCFYKWVSNNLNALTKICFRISVFSTFSLLYFILPHIFLFCTKKYIAHKLKFQGYKKWFLMSDCFSQC